MENWGYLIESEINSINFDSENKKLHLGLHFPWCDGTGRILANGVIDFVANEMRLSNIIDRAILLPSAENEVDIITAARRLFFLMRGRNPDSHELDWPILKERIKLISNRELFFLEIEPIHGASFLILALQIQLELPDDIKKRRN